MKKIKQHVEVDAYNTNHLYKVRETLKKFEIMFTKLIRLVEILKNGNYFFKNGNYVDKIERNIEKMEK